MISLVLTNLLFNTDMSSPCCWWLAWSYKWIWNCRHLFSWYSKKFDTINHELLLEKLHKHGIVDKELKWFRNYLQDRSQAVFCNGKLSNTIELDIGVPQGSMLGWFLFLVFINDLNQAISDGYNNMFADDTCLYTISKSVREVQMSLHVSLMQMNGM